MKVDFEAVVRLVLDTKATILDLEQAHQVTVKGTADYVTKVDLAVQSRLKQALAARYPEIQFLGEEGQKQSLDWARPVWILDPIDGTTNLIHNLKSSAVSLGLWDGGALAFGCVYNPFREELYTAISGQGAFLNGQPIHVSHRPALSQSLILFGTTPYEKARAGEVFDRAKRIFVQCEDLRRSGSAALDLCTIACGRADGYFEANLKPWDFAGGTVVLREAGGTITDFQGREIFPGENADVVVTNGLIHSELLELI